MKYQEYNTLKTYLEDPFTNKPNLKKNERNWAKQFLLIGKQIYRKTKWENLAKVLRTGETQLILYLSHNDPLAGYFGINKTYQKIRRRYFWPKMYEEIKQYIESCHQCQIQELTRKNNPIFSIEPTGP